MGFFWDPKSHIPNPGIFGIFFPKISIPCHGTHGIFFPRGLGFFFRGMGNPTKKPPLVRIDAANRRAATLRINKCKIGAFDMGNTSSRGRSGGKGESGGFDNLGGSTPRFGLQDFAHQSKFRSLR